MERLYEIRDELKQLDFHSYNSLGVVEQYFRCRLWVDLSRACFNLSRKFLKSKYPVSLLRFKR